MGVPVLSVGNLTLGGTGKTPLVRWIARWFHERGVRVAVVSRGYGASGGQPNDEALELRKSLPHVPHLQNPDRVAAARSAIEKFQSQLIVLDDGFQHRRLARDLDIVLLDALAPFGFGHVFPRGMLREPVDGLRRADVVILSRADHLDPAERAALWQTVRRCAPQAAGAEVIHAPRRLISAAGAEMPLDSVRGQSVAAFCGLGNPAGFRHTLETCGCRVVGFREFSDHHQYTPADLDALAAWAAGLDARPCCVPARTWSSCPSTAWAAARFGRWTSSWSFSPGKRRSSRNCRRCYRLDNHVVTTPVTAFAEGVSRVSRDDRAFCTLRLRSNCDL